MNKEVYSRIEDKLDKHTAMLTQIQLEQVQEVSLLKLAHQRLKYGTAVLAILFALKVTIDYPKLTVFIKTIL